MSRAATQEHPGAADVATGFPVPLFSLKQDLGTRPFAAMCFYGEGSSWAKVKNRTDPYLNYKIRAKELKSGLSGSPISAETKEWKESTVEGQDRLSSESEAMSRCEPTGSSSLSDASDPEAPDKSLVIAVLAFSPNHSSSGSTLEANGNVMD